MYVSHRVGCASVGSTKTVGRSGNDFWAEMNRSERRALAGRPSEFGQSEN